MTMLVANTNALVVVIKSDLYSLVSFFFFFLLLFFFAFSLHITKHTHNAKGYEQADAKANQESKTSSGGGGSSSSSRRTVLKTQTSRSGALDRGPSMQQMDDAIADAGLDDDEDFAEESETLRLNVNGECGAVVVVVVVVVAVAALIFLNIDRQTPSQKI